MSWGRITADDTTGPSDDNSTCYGFGLGFNWGQATLDMQIGESLFTDPVTTMGGWNWSSSQDAISDDGAATGGSTNLAHGEVTLSYSF